MSEPDYQHVVAEILAEAGATRESASWTRIAESARARYRRGDDCGGSNTCVGRTYFYAVAWGGFHGHMGMWRAAVLDDVVSTTHRRRTPPREAVATPPPAAPTLDDIGKWFDQEE